VQQYDDGVDSPPSAGLPPDDWRLVGVLADERRRAIFSVVRAADHPVTRDEVAHRANVGRPLAAFHLDKLANAGLLEVSFAREPGRGGRGAGRPAKRYADASRQVALSVPERRYDLLGEILARAIDESGPGESARSALWRVAGYAGEQLGERRGRAGRGVADTLGSMATLLSQLGYEPEQVTGRALRLRNCPFQAVMKSAPELVCHVNHAFIAGLRVGIAGSPRVTVDLDPQPGYCCVRIGGDRPVTTVA